MLDFHFQETLVYVDISFFQDPFDMRAVLFPLKTTLAFLGFFEGWACSLAPASVGALEKIWQLPTGFQIDCYMYIYKCKGWYSKFD